MWPKYPRTDVDFFGHRTNSSRLWLTWCVMPDLWSRSGKEEGTYPRAVILSTLYNLHSSCFDMTQVWLQSHSSSKCWCSYEISTKLRPKLITWSLCWVTASEWRSHTDKQTTIHPTPETIRVQDQFTGMTQLLCTLGFSSVCVCRIGYFPLGDDLRRDTLCNPPRCMDVLI